MKTSCRVEILGREYSLRSEEGEERIRQIAAYLNAKIKEVAEKSQTVSTVNVAVLAALNIAGDYFQSLDEQARMEKAIAARSNRLIEMIESKVG